jgi:hypothetical protein
MPQTAWSQGLTANSTEERPCETNSFSADEEITHPV